MQKKLLVLAALILSTVLPARSEVLIYQGTGSVVQPPGVSFPPVIQAFLIYDIPNKMEASITFFKVNGIKTQVSSAPVAKHMTTSPLPGGGTARIISSSSSSETLPSFADSINYVRGTQKTLTIATAGAVDTTTNEPRSIKGTILSVSGTSGGSGSFVEGRLKLLYQELPTVAANNAAKTLQQTLDGIVAELTAKGYNPP